MLDFAELSADGQDLELLTREILLKKGLATHWSGKGPDGGRDLICMEKQDSVFVSSERRWLVQCKHKAVSGNAVGLSDLDNVVDSCQQHACTGYVLVCSTYPSSAVVQRLEAITTNTSRSLVTTYWDAVRIEQILSTASNWSLAQRFFPKSAHAWRVYATDRPNQWVVIHKGYYFQLFNRIGSRCEFHFGSIERRVEDIERIVFPADHFLRIRAVYYNDKGGEYTWYLDYMHPHDQDVSMSAERIESTLGDGYALEDGQLYTFEVRERAYFKWSDHHDLDHSDYYKDIALFSHGLDRPQSRESMEKALQSEQEFLDAVEKQRTGSYELLIKALNRVSCLRIVRSCNSTIEYLDRFCALRNWASLIEELEVETDRFFSAWFLFEVTDDVEFHRMMSFVPQSVLQHFKLACLSIYLPVNDSLGSRREDDPNELLYELTLSVHPATIIDKSTGRALLNRYFEATATAIDRFVEAAV